MVKEEHSSLEHVRVTEFIAMDGLVCSGLIDWLMSRAIGLVDV